MTSKVIQKNTDEYISHNEKCNTKEYNVIQNKNKVMTVRIKNSEYEELQKIAEKLEVPVSVIIRRAVKEFLRRWKNAESEK